MKGGFITFIILLAGSVCGQTVSSVATFHNIGMEIRFAAAPAPGTVITTAIKEASSPEPLRRAHPLVRIASNVFAGSFFHLKAGTTYSIQWAYGAVLSNLSVATRGDIFPSATNRTLHVATNGDDSATGLTAGDPLRTVAHAIALASAGDRIWLHAGIYREGDLDVSKSGASNQPIVVESAPGEQAVLDGTDTNFPAAWSVYDAVNALYRTPWTPQPVNAYLNGQQFYRYLDLEDLRANTWGQSVGYHVDGAWFYARFPDSGAPGTNLVTVPAFTTAIHLSGSWFQFRDLEFRFYGRDEFHRGIYLDDADYNVIDRCRFHHNGVGVAIKRAAHFNTVQYCLFDESPVQTFAWSAVKEGGGDYEAGGVIVYGSSSSNQGNVIRYNTFQNMFDGAHLYSDVSSGPTMNMDVHDNIFIHCGDDGIETDGAGSNVRVYNNTFRDFLTGLSVAPATRGPLFVFRNLFSGWHGVEIYEGYPFKFNHGYAETTDWVHLYHNTCFTDVPGQDGFLFKNYSRWTNIISRNNIYAGTDYALENWSGVNPVNFDYDALHTTHATRWVHWAGTAYPTLAAFRTATGQETNGLAGDPLFRHAATNDFRLRPESPLIDRGGILPGINDDYVGPAPDIGAFEFQHDAQTMTLDSGLPGCAWSVVSGRTYRIEKNTNLSSPIWLGAEPALASNTTWRFTDTNLLSSFAIYRLAVTP